MTTQTKKDISEVSQDHKSNDFFVKLLSNELTLNQLMRSNRHITSLFLPYTNEILFYALLNQKGIQSDSLNKKLSSNANKILNSNNLSIKSEILKSERFKKAVEYLFSQTNSKFDYFFISKFASIIENYLLRSPELIEKEIYFLVSFFPFIIASYDVYLLFSNLLDSDFSNSNLNSYLIHEYLNKNHFIDFLFSNLSDETINLLIKCAQVETFKSPSFVNHLLNFNSFNYMKLYDFYKLEDRKWDIIAKYAKEPLIDNENDKNYSEKSLSIFMPLIKQAYIHIEPTFEDYFSQSQVSALQFMTTMFIYDPINAENTICSTTCLLETLKRIIICFPNHTIAINEIFLLVEVLITSTTATTRTQAIEVFIPITHELLMFQKFRSSREPKKENQFLDQSENDIVQSDQPKKLYSFFNHCCSMIQEKLSKENENVASEIELLLEKEEDDDDNEDDDIQEIKKIANRSLRGFAASFLNRIMEHEDNDSELENELNDNDLYQDSIEYLIEVYNPLSESGYGYNNSISQISINKKPFHPSFPTFTKRGLGLINRSTPLVI